LTVINGRCKIDDERRVKRKRESLDRGERALYMVKIDHKTKREMKC
jgi:hypothetical protein